MNKTTIPVLLIAITMGITHYQAYAQSDTATVKHFMQKVQHAYAQASYLGFKVLYRYANQNQPGNYMDSLQGEMAMDKNRMRFVIDNVETITARNYTIRVMKEEKLIYLSKAAQTPMADPVNMLDSALAHIQGVTTELTHNGKSSTLNIHFPPGQIYKNISMTIDESTGFLQRTVYDLYTESFVGTDQIQ